MSAFPVLWGKDDDALRRPTSTDRLSQHEPCYGWAIGAGTLERQKTEAEATAEARDMTHIHGRAYVYRTPSGALRATTNEPEIMPGHELLWATQGE